MGYIMFALAFVLGYPLFMVTAYLLAKTIFVKIDEDDATEKLRQEARVIRENRLRFKIKKQRLAHA